MSTRETDVIRVGLVRLRSVAVALLVAGLAGMAWSASDPYRVRASLFTVGKLRTPADVTWTPDARPAWHVVDTAEDLSPYAATALEKAGEGTTRARATRLLAHVSALGGDDAANDERLDWSETDDVGDLMEQVRRNEFRGNCAHYSFIYLSLANAAGIDARMAGINGERWIDAQGHGLIEVYLPESGAWMIVDPLFHATFEDATGRPLALIELRDLLLSGREDEVEVLQGEIRAMDKSPSAIIRYYKRNIVRASYPGSNNILGMRKMVYDNAFARLVALDEWPRKVRRAVENIFWDYDRRYLYVDEPQYDDPLIPWYVSRASVASLLVGALMLVWSWLPR